MANQQAFQAYAQNKGTLIPGQSISVNKYQVQVERYLSQGGFAHVYLVRTAVPVYNTTHHVLKRIAVANDAMLTEVKKEVDIMRLLKGHPNIVHLIDAAWHRMPNGLYEVFILMEFCSGGGIIDMMNRRLRERLTETEILQIFVDVCEGVAYMHNLRPPLLHRDLKVENILQSSPMSFKLCDFGSATTVASRPPASTQEIRALEADLNRHTTLQYRAPEMVDCYLRRAVDEKSDVWALGVLLYKLCYYTTPFEEHGPLAILNVQYRIPPYPVYSPQMNSLIGSMLREHGAQRPSVFDLLAHVHQLRGTKSQFQYVIPVPQPLSPRRQQQVRSSPIPNPLDSTISYRSAPQTAKNSMVTLDSDSPPINQGVQAREKVLEAIAPMRRGRPVVPKEPGSSSRPSSPHKPTSSPHKPVEQVKGWAGEGFIAAEDQAWNAATAHSAAPGKKQSGLDDVWDVGARDKSNEHAKVVPPRGFGDDFGEKLWEAFDHGSDGRMQSSSKPTIPSTPKINLSTSTPTTTSLHQVKPISTRAKDRDAFEGLGLSSNMRPEPTLGEARKLRTGLATTSTPMNRGSPSRYGEERLGSNTTRFTLSPQVSLLQPQSKSSSPGPLLNSSSPSLSVHQPPSRPGTSGEGFSAESRFPSLEELDATYMYTTSSDTSKGSGKSNAHAHSQPQLVPNKSSLLPPRSNGNGMSPVIGTSGSSKLALAGVRSEQVTGVAMRDSRKGQQGDRSGDTTIGDNHGYERERDTTNNTALLAERTDSSASKPTIMRKHRSSVSIQQVSHSSSEGNVSTSSASQSSGARDLAPPSTSASAPRLPARRKAKDWLTGDDDEHVVIPPSPSPSPAEVPVLRESPSKRASYIEKSSLSIPEAVVAQHDHVSASKPLVEASTPAVSPTLSRFTQAFPPLETAADIEQERNGPLTDNWSPVLATTATRSSPKPQEAESSSSADEGPEEAIPASNKFVEDARKSRRKGRQSSVHDLVDLWGGGLSNKEKEDQLHVNDVKPSESVIRPNPQKGRVGLTALSTKVNPSSGSVLSQSTTLHPDPGSSSRPSDTSPTQTRRPTTRGVAAAPASKRPRPQSMFIFPSKSESASLMSAGLPSPGLSPPDELTPRTTRRTSISDMVQRYEAIGGKPKISGQESGPISPVGLSRSTGLKVVTQPMENGRYSRRQTLSEKEKAGSTLQVTNDSAPVGSGDPSKSRLSPSKLNPTSPRVSRPSPVTASRNLHLRDLAPSEAELSAPRPRKLSHKPEQPKPTFPSRSATILANESSRSVDRRSPSPERPYQGVGKLIDQWQRKTAAADPSANVAGTNRSGLVAKRSGAIQGRGTADGG